MINIAIPALYGVTLDRIKRVSFVDVAQLPVSPIPPPPPAEALGLITWDMLPLVRYTPATPLQAFVQMSNPSGEARWYVIGYYFLDLNGIALAEGYIEFLCGDIRLNAFRLPPIAEAVEPAHFSLEFSSNENDRVFGLRMLLSEMVGNSAVVIQETSRVETLLASKSTYNRLQQSSLMNTVVGVAMVTFIASVSMKIFASA